MMGIINTTMDQNIFIELSMFRDNISFIVRISERIIRANNRMTIIILKFC